MFDEIMRSEVTENWEFREWERFNSGYKDIYVVQADPGYDAREIAHVCLEGEEGRQVAKLMAMSPDLYAALYNLVKASENTVEESRDESLQDAYTAAAVLLGNPEF